MLLSAGLKRAHEKQIKSFATHLVGMCRQVNREKIKIRRGFCIERRTTGFVFFIVEADERHFGKEVLRLGTITGPL